MNKKPSPLRGQWAVGAQPVREPKTQTMWITLWIAVVYYGENKWGFDYNGNQVYATRSFESKAEAFAWAEEKIDSWFDGDPWTVDKCLPCLYGAVRRVRINAEDNVS
tara:strand:- start:554 stop:874 length:321 start_codon:yes stop_codon:yes gene_type:complete